MTEMTAPTSASLMPHIPRNERTFAGDDCLVYYDGPLLMWLPTMMAPHLQGHRLLALAIAEDSLEPGWLAQGEHAWPFLVATLSVDDANAMLNDQKTLLATVLSARAWHIIPRYDAPTLSWIAVTREQLEQRGSDWLPGDAMLNK